MSTSIKVNGKEVQNPFLRFLVPTLILGLFILFIGIFGFTLILIPLMLGVVVAMWSLTIPLHFLLRLCGRRGFIVREETIHSTATSTTKSVTFKWTSAGAFSKRT